MKIKRLVIENFKSIERIELIEPNPFTAFVGPNGSGKSNIFEALEFVNLRYKTSKVTVASLFGGYANFLRRQDQDKTFTFNSYLEHFDIQYSYSEENYEIGYGSIVSEKENNLTTQQKESTEYRQYFGNFSRLFVKNDSLVKLSLKDDQRLALDASNLEKVLKRILTDDTLRNEIFEWLELFVPGFKAVEIDDRNELHWFEQSTPNHFTKDLISDGTYNILALLTAVYQSDDKPQFLCIEEPENGLHPQVARELVDFFRIMCEERGHYIWLNTHSQSMLSRVKPHELVIVEKKQGATHVKQIPEEEFKNWRMDEALLMNAFGGGLAW